MIKKPIKYKLAYFVSHPIQYQAPLLRLLAALPELKLKVFFLSDLSVTSFHDKGFGTSIQWDVPLLDGYAYEFLPHWRDNGTAGFWDPLIYGMRRVLKTTSWDAVWFHGYAHYAFLWGIRSAVSSKIPLFFRAESTLTCSQPNRIKDRFIRWLVKHASALLWVSSDNRDYYRYYGAGEDQLFFTPYTVDNGFFLGRSHEAEKQLPGIRQELKLKEDLPVILYAGKLIKRKNPVLLLKAYSHLSRDGTSPPAAYLLYVGDGEERPALEKQIAELGWQSHVKILGFKNQTQLPAYFFLCDLFAMPSQKEPFGLVVNEVMNAGKAIIGTDEVGASRDLIHEGRNGFIVPAGEENALAQALQRALLDRQELKKMGLESRKIIENWSLKQDVDGILQALEKVRMRSS